MRCVWWFFVALAFACGSVAHAQTSVATDNFNRASLGADWDQLNPTQGSMATFTSTVVGGGTSGADAARQAARWIGAGTFSDNQYASLEIVTLGNITTDYSMGVICRASADDDGARDYYEVVVFASSAGPDYTTQLGKVVNGTYTVLNSGSVAWAAADDIGIQCDGTSIRATKNGTAIGGSFTQTDSSLTTGAPGIAGSGDGSNTGDNWDAGNMAVSDVEQEGFRWGVDDNIEALHGWEAAQDTNISIADTQSRLLRAIVNAQAVDLATAAYTLRYQKNGAGGYAAVPVGANPASSITDRLVSTSTDDAQQVGTTMTLTGTTIGSDLDATTDWAAMRFNNITIPPGSTITTAGIDVVPSATTTDEPLVTIFLEDADDCATFTTTASDISNRALTTANASWSNTNLGADGATYFASPSLVTAVQEVIDRAGWASGNDLCVIVQGGATSTRDLTIEAQNLGPNTNPPRIDLAWTAPAEVYIATSANIAAGGEVTTALLTAPAGKSSVTDFVVGRRWDDENGSDSIDITNDDYTEIEWLVALSAAPVVSDYFEFRIYSGAGEFEVYTLTPRWTIPSAGGSIIPKIFHNRRQRVIY